MTGIESVATKIDAVLDLVEIDRELREDVVWDASAEVVVDSLDVVVLEFEVEEDVSRKFDVMESV